MGVKQSRAPEFPAHLEWCNVETPVRLHEQRGRVVILDFGTYCSLPCQYALADLHSLQHKYREDLAVIGIHAPKFPGEKTRDHVQKAINRNHIHHPVINDSEHRLWQLYGIHTRPTQVVIDTQGYIVGAVFGEGHREKLDQVIHKLLYYRGAAGAERFTPYALKPVPEPSRPLSFPSKLLVTENRLFIADSGHNRILITSPQGHILHQYGSDSPGLIDGTGTSAAFDNPQGMMLVDDFLYVADTGNHTIRRIHIHNDDVVTIAGTGKMAARLDSDYFSAPLEVDLNSPGGLAIKGNVIYIAMAGLHQIWALSLVTNTLEIIAGSGREGLVDGAARYASFAQPSALTILGHTLYVVDADSSAIRAVDLNTRHVTTLVGKGLQEYGDNDGSGADAKFQYPLDINADQVHNSLWIADTYNNKIKKIKINTNEVSSLPVHHPLSEPGGLAFSDNTLYIANTNSHEILRIDLRSGSTEALNVNDEYIGI